MPKNTNLISNNDLLGMKKKENKHKKILNVFSFFLRHMEIPRFSETLS